MKTLPNGISSPIKPNTKAHPDQKIIIAPSILAADYSKLGHEVKKIERSGADWIHFDVMDGNFVPNISFGPGILKAIRKFSKLPFDVHLMCKNPDILIKPFVEAGADNITIHVELDDKVENLLWLIKSYGISAGLALNPSTQLATIKPFLKYIKLLLIMTVNPGYGGQQFIEEMIPKIQQASQWIQQNNLDIRLEVDGGINLENVVKCVQSGANTIVSGTTLFAQRNLKSAITRLRKITEAALSQVKSHHQKTLSENEK